MQISENLCIVIPSHKEPLKNYTLNTNNNMCIILNGINANDTERSDCTLLCLTRGSCDSSETTAGEKS